MASICRYVTSDGQVTFARGLGKRECEDISETATWYEDEWKPYSSTSFLPEDMQFPMNDNKDATLELRDRENYRNSIWAQQGEEELIRQNAAFGANQGLLGDMTYAPQPEGYNYSPGTMRNEEMIARTIAPT